MAILVYRLSLSSSISLHGVAVARKDYGKASKAGNFEFRDSHDI
jgi:hypothetical protein